MTNILNKQKHADQRTRLLAHARHLFAVQGVSETSMSQVAKACKVTKATLYHYFKSKDAVLKEIFDCRSQSIEAVSKNIRAKNLEECLYQIARTHLKEMEETKNLEDMKIMISETMKSEEMRKFYTRFLKENLGRSAQTVAAFITRKKTEKELNLIFFQFISTLVHYDWVVKMMGDPSGIIGDEEAFIRQLVRTYAWAFQAV